MGSGKKSKNQEPVDPRVEATGTIWGATIAMMAIGIPIAAIFRSPTVFFVILGAAAAGSVALWAFGGGRARSRDGAGDTSELADENAALRARLAELEERLANVETISSLEMRLAADERARRDAAVAIDPETPGAPGEVGVAEPPRPRGSEAG